MIFNLNFTYQADRDLEELEKSPALLKRLKAVYKALGYLENNPRHPSLNTHKYRTLAGNYGEEVFEAYAENLTTEVFCILWHYGQSNNIINTMFIVIYPSNLLDLIVELFGSI